ncbi:MAG: precorrin-6y C5,15-methyltransferase (decarboxylating) subunit CbiE [Rhizobiales bacterium]|nr:precorrin-6y C5,15-methyltransferase (decarboxylating) subunit CbiE [Hyphomicrobiales bacterium]
MAAQPAADGPWLAIVGIGEDGVEGLSPAARKLVSGAEIVFGGQRHLALADAIITGARRPWPSPFAIDAVLARRGEKVCVLASGDPFVHGIGALLAREVPPSEMTVMPAPSAFSLAAARLGWPLPEVTMLALHARAPDLLRPHLHPGARILALVADGTAAAEIAALLAGAGFGGSRVTALEALGGPRERIRSVRADTFDLAGIDPLNLVAIEVAADADACIIPRAPGLPDDAFAHDGQITKREVRALTLSALAPVPGELLWDIGAGSGSVVIEWMLAHPSLRAIAIESKAKRAERIRLNARNLGVPDLAVVVGSAPAALAQLAPPDAVFVGGGASDPGVLDAAIAALRPGGRMVVNGVTLETEALLLARHADLGGELTRIAIQRAAPIGTMTAFRPAMPVTQWRWVRP